ncbi:MAG: thioredoxin domain-containing protein, partial [Thiobacillaceae bacterium]|nr:thioredoxin domain-containing protein [Thiobacillaceae bacterium]
MKKSLFLSAAAILVLAFVAGVYFYSTSKTEQAGQLAQQNRSVLVRDYSPVLGPADAKVEIVEFFDPACETCRRFYPFVKEILAAEPERVRLVLRYAPFHQNSDYVVALLEAARMQGKYWETLEALLASQDAWVVHHAVQPQQAWMQVQNLGLDLERLQHDMQSPEIAARIRQELADADTLKVMKTPELFVNGKPLPSFG